MMPSFLFLEVFSPRDFFPPAKVPRHSTVEIFPPIRCSPTLGPFITRSLRFEGGHPIHEGIFFQAAGPPTATIASYVPLLFLFLGKKSYYPMNFHL